jgi:hypothetical protein
VVSILEAGVFQRVVEDYIAGQLSKEQALKLLESKYKSALINIKEAFGKDHQSFCCYVPCDFDQYIKICDGAERNKPMSECLVNNNSNKIIQKIIDKVAATYKKSDLESGNVVVEVYQEVHQIQNWCRENRELTKWYEKYKTDIEATPDIPTPQVNISQPNYIQDMIEKGLLYPDGKRVLGKLENIATYLYRDVKISITEKFLQETFLKSDGTQYSKSACKKALNVATTE